MQQTPLPPLSPSSVARYFDTVFLWCSASPTAYNLCAWGPGINDKLSRVCLGTFCAAVFGIAPTQASENFNLRCDLLSGSGETHHYAFRIEIPNYFGNSRVTWVGDNTHDLKVVRLDDTVIIANLEEKVRGWPDKAIKQFFRLNRITGAAEMNYLRNLEPSDPKVPEGVLPVMGAFTETGTCSKAERAF